MYVDRDIDKVMHRTRKRPLVTGAIAPRNALVFAIALEVVAFVELWRLVNLLSAVLAVSATLFYVFVYTLWLKRTSSQNIVIGGAAGAVPVLVGWAAVTDSLTWTPVVMFAVIFIWTPPHFWALAFKYKDDYAAANVPMLPAVATFRRTAVEILVYTVLLVGVSLLLASVAHLGPVYVVGRLGPRGGVHRPVRPALAPEDPQGGHAAVQLLDHLPDPAVRAHGRRRLHQALIRHPGTGAGIHRTTRATRSGPAVRGRPVPTGPAARRVRPSPQAAAAVPAHRLRRRRRAGRLPLRRCSEPSATTSSGQSDGGRPGSVAPGFTLPTSSHRRPAAAPGRPRRPGQGPAPPGGPQLLRLVVHPVPGGDPAAGRHGRGRGGQGIAVQFVGVDVADLTAAAVAFTGRPGITYPVGADPTLRGDLGALRPQRRAQHVLHQRGRGGRSATPWGRSPPSELDGWLHRLAGSAG